MRMRSIGTVLLIGVGAVMITGCFGGYLADYHFRLAADGSRPGEPSIGTAKEASGTSVSGRVVEVPPFGFEWFVNDYGIHVSMRNNGATPAVVLWREATFWDESGTQHRMWVATDLYSKRPLLQEARIEPKQLARYDLFPEDYIRVSPDSGHLHMERELFVPPGSKVGRTAEDIIALARPNVGTTVKIRVPVMVDGERIDYQFLFTVVRLGARRYNAWI